MKEAAFFHNESIPSLTAFPCLFSAYLGRRRGFFLFPFSRELRLRVCYLFTNSIQEFEDDLSPPN